MCQTLFALFLLSLHEFNFFSLSSPHPTFLPLSLDFWFSFFFFFFATIFYNCHILINTQFKNINPPPPQKKKSQESRWSLVPFLLWGQECRSSPEWSPCETASWQKCAWSWGRTPELVWATARNWPLALGQFVFSPTKQKACTPLSVLSESEETSLADKEWWNAEKRQSNVGGG